MAEPPDQNFLNFYFSEYDWKGEKDSESSSSHNDHDFQCVVVDNFSSGSYWMITKCNAAWPDDQIKENCETVSCI